MQQKLKNYLEGGNRAQWCIFIIFAFTIFLKGIVFHWDCYHSILLSSLWKNPLEFWRFWIGKIIPALFLASFIFISKRKWWTIIVNILVDIWLVSNMFYFKANSLFLSYETMKMADNMSGFWSSLSSYLGRDIYIYFVITSIYFIFFQLFGNGYNTRNYNKFFCLLLSSILLSIFNNYLYSKSLQRWECTDNATTQVNSLMLKEEDFHYYYPFGHVYYYATVKTWSDYNVWASTYVKEYSILSYFPATFVFSAMRPAGEIITLDQEDVEIIESLMSTKESCSYLPKTNLVFILFESLESWPLDEICEYNYMPFLSSLIDNEHVLYCDKLKSQVKHGNSADGQMIDVTGVLPISNGASCRLYADNTFAGYAECYRNTAIINPAPGTWGQSNVTKGYQFKELLEPQKGEHWEDVELVCQIEDYVRTTEPPFCVLGITVSSHVPFTRGAQFVKKTVDGMPLVMSAYLNSLSYTDSCIHVLCDAIWSDERLKEKTSIVISGDHTIFRSVNKEMDDFAMEHSINMQTTKTYIPLIVYSPQIEKNYHVTDTCYQMDIYPTIMHLIGCEDYYWKGFGINLLDSAARNNRTITEEEAYKLSEKLIQSNYFAARELKL